MSRRAAAAFAVAVCSLFAPAMFARTATPAMPVTQTFAFEQSSYVIAEAAGSITMNIVRSGDLSSSTSISASAFCCSGSATSPADFQSTSQTLTFAPGESVKPFTVLLADDQIFEGPETFNVQICCVNFATATVTILDDETPTFVGFESSPTLVSENAGSAPIAVVRSGDVSKTSSVRLDAGAGTATAGSDFTALSTTVTFAAGETRKVVAVPIINDSISEPDETVALVLTQPSNCALSLSNAQIVIQDDEPPSTIGFSSASYAVNESVGLATITVLRSGDTSGAASVAYSTPCCGSAFASADYVSVSGTLSFAPGETTKTFTIPILDDFVAEGTETINLALTNVAGARLGTSSALVMIVDNDTDTSIGFDSTNYSVREDAGSVTLRLVRIGDTSRVASAVWTTTSNGATGNVDYVTSTGTIVFTAGETSKTITIPIIDDILSEGSENFFVGLSGVGGVATRGGATVTVVDDEVPVVVQFSKSTHIVAENAGSVAVVLTRSGNLAMPLSVSYSTADCCSAPSPWASAGLDYVGTSGVVFFDAGETAKTISISILDDTVREGNKSFQISANGAPTAAITIVDDETPPSSSSSFYLFSPAFATVRETDGSVTLTLTRTDTTVPASVQHAFQTQFLGATAGADFIGTPGTFSFAAGEGSKTLTIPIVNDAIAEGTESFALTASVNSTIVASVQVNITDDDSATSPVLTIDSVAVPEGNSPSALTLTARLSRPAEASFSFISLAVSGGTANAADFSLPGTSVVFNVGDTEKKFAVVINGDTVPEPDETLFIGIAGLCCANVTTTRGTLTILNDDAAVSISDAAVTEGNNGTKPLSFTVSLSPAQTLPVSVDYATLNAGSASESDYAPAAGTLQFAPGETTKTIDIDVNGDLIPESNETFGLRLLTVTGAALTRAVATGTILDDDDPYSVTRDIEYANADGVSLELDLYTPNGGAGPYPLVIWIHGDHWGDGVRWPNPAIREASRGYAVAAIDIRSIDVDIFPAQIDDAKAAVRFLRANAARFNLDANRFAAWGFGSGGHIASLLGTSGDVDSLTDAAEGNPAISSRVQAVVSWAAPYDLMQLPADAPSCNTINYNSSGSFVSIFLGCPLEFCGIKAWDASPGRYASKDDPPFLLVHSDDDCEVGLTQAQGFLRILKSAKVEVTLKTLHNFGHLMPSQTDPAAALVEIDNFLDAKLPPVSRRRNVMH